MRHIIKFKLFESFDEISQNIKDLIIDINDTREWEASFWLEDDTYIISISPNNKAKFNKEFVYIIKSAISFMESEGFSSRLLVGGENDSPFIIPGEPDYLEDPIDIDDLESTKLYSNEYIRLEFKK